MANKVNLGLLLRKRASLIGSTLRNRSDAFKAQLIEGLKADFKEEIRSGALKPIIDTIYPLENAGDAHRRMSSSLHYGKIVLSLKPM